MVFKFSIHILVTCEYSLILDNDNYLLRIYLISWTKPQEVPEKT